MLYAAGVTDRAKLDAPGICHYDDSARVQTVDQADDPFLHAVLRRVGEATGVPLVINTSLNPRGAPILSKLAETRAFQRALRGLDVRIFHEGKFVTEEA